MTNVYLLRNYKNYVANEIIEVSDIEATELIKSNIARLTFGRDYLVKPTSCIKNVISRAFKISPKIK